MATIIEKRESKRGCGYRKPGGFYLVNDAPGQPCGRLPIPLTCCPCCGTGIKYARGITWIDPAPLLKDRDCAFAKGIGEPDCACPASDARNFGRWIKRPVASPEEGKKLVRQLQNTLMPGIQSCEVVKDADWLYTAEELGEVRSGPARYGVIGRYPHVMLLWVGKQFYTTPGTYMDEAAKLGVSRRLKAIPRNFELGKTWVWLAHMECIPDMDGAYLPGVFHMFKPQRMEYVITGKETEEELDSLEKRGFTVVNVTRLGEQTEFEDDEE